ncbi:MAG: PEP-CTERM sorting domain-containing protein [Pseudomonadota bacterium]
MRIVFALLLLLAPALAVSGTIRSYDLTGKVSGPGASADYLRDISVDDDIFIKLRLNHDDSGHKLNFSGNIGSWSFSPQETAGLYSIGDSAPERFFTLGSSSVLEPPVGNVGQILAVDLFLTLFGFDEDGTVSIPESQRLVKSDGSIDTAWFRSGQLSFNFLALYDPATGEGVETDLNGTIDAIRAIPEPSSALLLCMGMLSVGVAALQRRRRKLRL